jgi:prophage DNA circulation protein
MPVPLPDYVLDATARILSALVPLFERTPGPIADATRFSAYRRTIATLKGDTRAAARSLTLEADIAAIAEGYRVAASDMRAVIRGLERVVVAARAQRLTEPLCATLALQRENERSLLLLFEAVALAEAGNAVSALAPRSYDEAADLRLRLGRAFDLTIERASDMGAHDLMRPLREVQAALTRDLIERGRPLARLVAYETGVPLPSAVLAHRFYQDASRAAELRAENGATDHPSFMPLVGRAYSR